MKSKQFISAIALALTTLTAAEASAEINQHREALLEKCDSLMKSATIDFTKDDHTQRRADVCVLAEEPWKAVMHGLMLQSIDPNSIGLYRGGFMAKQIEKYLQTQTNVCVEGQFNERQYFFAMSLAIERVRRFMDHHGWSDAFEKDESIKAMVLAARTKIKEQVLPSLEEARNLTEEASNIIGSEQINYTSRRNRFVGVQRHLSHNRDNLVRMAEFMANCFHDKKYVTFADQISVVINATLPTPVDHRTVTVEEKRAAA